MRKTRYERREGGGGSKRPNIKLRILRMTSMDCYKHYNALLFYWLTTAIGEFIYRIHVVVSVIIRVVSRVQSVANKQLTPDILD